MSKPLTKSQIVEHLATGVGVSKKVASSFLSELATLACKEAGNSFTIPGIGKLVVQERSARKGRNPATGEVIDIPAKKVIKFRVSKAYKDAVLGQ